MIINIYLYISIITFQIIHFKYLRFNYPNLYIYNFIFIKLTFLTIIKYVNVFPVNASGATVAELPKLDVLITSVYGISDAVNLMICKNSITAVSTAALAAMDAEEIYSVLDACGALLNGSKIIQRLKVKKNE